MSRFQTELENLQQQQREAIEKMQTAEQEALRQRELALKLQGAIEVLQSMGGAVPEEEVAQPAEAEVVSE